MKYPKKNSRIKGMGKPWSFYGTAVDYEMSLKEHYVNDKLYHGSSFEALIKKLINNRCATKLLISIRYFLVKIGEINKNDSQKSTLKAR